MIEYPTPDGNSAPGYLTSSSDDAPGLIVLQEWWGLNDQIKSTGDRFAEAGYRVIVPDLFRGRITQDPDEANHMMTGLDWGGAASQDIRGAAQYLKGNGKKVGVLGFCMGGALTIIASVHVPEVDAGVCFYGIPPEAAADPSKIKVPFQGHFAALDAWCTPELVNDLEAKLKSGGVTHELHRYSGDHAFFNEARTEVYDAAAAAQAMERSLSFLKTHL